MAKISMLISDEDLALIDAAASPNRTAFMVAAAKDAALRIQRAREDAEIVRILEEGAADDQALLDEFSGTVGDGI